MNVLYRGQDALASPKMISYVMYQLLINSPEPLVINKPLRFASFNTRTYLHTYAAPAAPPAMRQGLQRQQAAACLQSHPPGPILASIYSDDSDIEADEPSFADAGELWMPVDEISLACVHG